MGMRCVKCRSSWLTNHPVVREGIRRLLEMDERVQVVGEAANAAEALSLVPSTSAKVVLMDVRLPGMDGIEAKRRLKVLDPELRVIILSSFGERYLIPCIEAGACGYILKTATQPEMASVVIRAADGQSPIDPALAKLLFNRAGQTSRRSGGPGLSQRQQEILRMVAGGVASKGIAARLSVSDARI